MTVELTNEEAYLIRAALEYYGCESEVDDALMERFPEEPPIQGCAMEPSRVFNAAEWTRTEGLRILARDMGAVTGLINRKYDREFSGVR